MIKIGMPELFEYDNIEDNFKLAKELDLDFIELNLNFSNTRKLMEEDKIYDLLNKYNLVATLHFFDEADFAGLDLVVDAYLNLLDKYLSLGSKYIKQVNVHLQKGPIVTISGTKNYIYQKEYEIFIKRLINNLYKAKNIAKKYNINLVIENTEDLPLFFKDVYKDLYNNDFRFCYDIGHDHISGNIVLDVLNEYNLKFDEFHIHDAKNKNKCHLSLGEGELDIKKYKELSEKNNSYVVIEVKSSKDLINSIPIFKKL